MFINSLAAEISPSDESESGCIVLFLCLNTEGGFKYYGVGLGGFKFYYVGPEAFTRVRASLEILVWANLDFINAAMSFFDIFDLFWN